SRDNFLTSSCFSSDENSAICGRDGFDVLNNSPDAWARSDEFRSRHRTLLAPMPLGLPAAQTVWRHNHCNDRCVDASSTCRWSDSVVLSGGATCTGVLAIKLWVCTFAIGALPTPLGHLGDRRLTTVY